MDKRSLLDMVVLCAHQYELNLNNKNIMFVMKSSKSLYFFEAKFEDINFLHLTGFATTLDTRSFYQACLNSRISPDEVSIKSKTTILKLSVLSKAMSIDTTAKMCGEYNSNGFNLYTQKLVGNVSVCLGLLKDKNSDYYIPNTVLKEDIRNVTIPPVSKIICTFKKDVSEEKYNQLCLVGKNVDITALNLPKEISDKLSNKLKERFNIPFEEENLEELVTVPKAEMQELMKRKAALNSVMTVLNSNPQLKSDYIAARDELIQKQKSNSAPILTNTAQATQPSENKQEIKPQQSKKTKHHR